MKNGAKQIRNSDISSFWADTGVAWLDERDQFKVRSREH